jgi:aarF domain-containing kinase
MKQTFHYGIIHGDPHGGNVFVRKSPDNGRTQLVLIDHGVVKYLSEELRMNYAYLWKGILTQDEAIIKYAAEKLGANEHYYLFAAMITGRPWHTIMNKNQKDVKVRLAIGRSTTKKKIAVDRALRYRHLINKILNDINPDLLMMFKVKDYLNSIDTRLGSPINTFYYTAKYSMREIDSLEMRSMGIFGRMGRRFNTN